MGGKKTKERNSMPKQATKVALSEKELEGLTQIIKRHKSEQQHVVRARILLLAEQRRSNADIARELGINVDTARLWRDRWVGLQGVDLETLRIEERLEDVPRPGKPSKITEEQRCKIAALAIDAPLNSGRPISQWTEREIADEVMKQGIVAKISSRHAGRLIKKKG
jgi:putative transposase